MQLSWRRHSLRTSFEEQHRYSNDSCLTHNNLLLPGNARCSVAEAVSRVWEYLVTWAWFCHIHSSWSNWMDCSETGCSLARHFAILSLNVGILISSLLRASCDSNFNLLLEQTGFHIGILWVDCDGKQQYLCLKEEKCNFPLVVRLSKSRNMLHLSHQTVSNILSKFLQNGTAVPGNKMERTHGRYSKCCGICGVLQGF